MTELLLQAPPENFPLTRYRLAAAGAMLACVALSGACSATAPPSPEKTTSFKVVNGIECELIHSNDVMLDCTAAEPGQYSLYLHSFTKPDDKPIATYHVQVKGDKFNLIPTKPYVPNCTQGFVTLAPKPSEVPAATRLVYEFDVCGN